MKVCKRCGEEKSAGSPPLCPMGVSRGGRHDPVLCDYIEVSELNPRCKKCGRLLGPHTRGQKCPKNIKGMGCNS